MFSEHVSFSKVYKAIQRDGDTHVDASNIHMRFLRADRVIINNA